MKKKPRKPRNYDVLFMITHCKGGYHKLKKFKRSKNKEHKEKQELDSEKE